MRLVGTALFTAWLLAWGAAPKGELARATTAVGGLAIAGADDVAVAWLEVAHARPRGSETLHVATVDRGGQLLPRFNLDGHDDVAYRLTESGPARFALVSEHRTRLDRYFEFRRFGRGTADRPPDLRATFNASTWEVAAAGDQLTLVEEDLSGETAVHVLDEDGRWLPSQAAGRTLLGSGGGSVIRYEVGRHADRVVVSPAGESPWVMEVSHPRCTLPSSAAASAGPTGGEPALASGAAAISADEHERTLSVVGLPGGYGRMARLGRWLCVDGIRSGSYFRLDPVPIGDVVDPRLVADADARLSISDANDGKGALFLRRLEGVAPGASPFVWGPRPRTVPGGEVLRGYSIFHVGASGGAALITRASAGETRVLLERFPLPDGHSEVSAGGGSGELLLGPARHYLPDHRPLLRVLAVAPLGVLAMALLGAVGLVRRLRRVTPPSAAAPLGEGPVAIEAQLATDAEAPTGALRLRRGGHTMLLFIEGAEVIRASDVRPRSEPRGDAVDVASGAPVLATGRFRRGAVFRGEDSLHAGGGDLVLVGCTLAEARARLAVRLGLSAALFSGALAAVLLLVR